MAAGLDLHACLDAPIVLEPQAPAILISAGIAFRIGDPEWCAFVVPRSGLGHKRGLVLGNTVGVIDAGLRGANFDFGVEPPSRISRRDDCDPARRPDCSARLYSHRAAGILDRFGVFATGPPTGGRVRLDWSRGRLSRLACRVKIGTRRPGARGLGDMIRLTKKLLFAIEAVLDIAYNGGEAPVRSSEITERQGIPRRYLEPVLQELVRNKILFGIRGPSGGYRLAREGRGISLGDIVRTLQGLETAEDPISDPAGSPLGHRIVRPLWLDLQQEMMQRLDALTMEELCGRAHRAGIADRTTE